MKTALFVCTGNTCRSPLAAAVCRYLKLPFEPKSAGLFADGSPYSENAVKAAAEIGVDISGGISRRLEKEDLSADIIFCAGRSHRDALLLLGADEEKIRVLDLPDPFGGDLDIYRRCRDDIINKLSPFKINIRKLDESDAKAVAEIEKICFSRPWSESAVIESLRFGADIFAAENRDGLIGYAGMNITAGEGYITNIAVKPEYRGIGVGGALLDALLSICREREADFLSLEVRASNSRAIKLYESRGFTLRGMRHGYYVNPAEDALIYTKEISD